MVVPSRDVGSQILAVDKPTTMRHFEHHIIVWNLVTYTKNCISIAGRINVSIFYVYQANRQQYLIFFFFWMDKFLTCWKFGFCIANGRRTWCKFLCTSLYSFAHYQLYKSHLYDLNYILISRNQLHYFFFPLVKSQNEDMKFCHWIIK